MKHLIDSSPGVLGLFYGFLFACLFAGFFGFCLLGFVLGFFSQYLSFYLKKINLNFNFVALYYTVIH